MNRTIQFVAGVAISVSLAGCYQPWGWEPKGKSPTRVNGAITGADVAAQITVASGSTGLVDHYTLTLQQDGTTVAMAGNPASLASSSSASATFSAVPNGTNYTLVADGVDACGVSTGAVTSAAFDIVDGGIVNHGTTTAASTPIVLALTLPSATADLTVQVSGGAAGAIAGISLLNLADFTTTTQGKSVATDPTDFLFSNVAAGATSGHSHELFHYFVDTGTSQATVAKSQLVAGTCAGRIDTTSITLNYSMTQAPWVFESAVAPQLHTGGFGHTYYTDPFGPMEFVREDGVRIDLTNGGLLPIPDMTAFTVAPLNGHDKFFYYDTNDTMIHAITDQGGTPTNFLDLTSQNMWPVAMAADAGGAVYWVDSGNVWKLPGNVARSFGNAVEVINTGTVTGLAVDAYGHIFYAVGNTIYRAPLGSANGTVYGAGVQVVTAGSLTAISVDAVGNLYYKDGSNLKMVPSDDRSHVYGVAGASTWVEYPSVGADGTLFYVDLSHQFQRIDITKL